MCVIKNDQDDHDSQDDHHCLFMEEKAINAWEMQAPMLIILIFNTFFLIWVISVRGIFICNCMFDISSRSYLYVMGSYNNFNKFSLNLLEAKLPFD